MARIQWAVALSLIFSVCSLAGDGHTRLSTRYEIQHNLLTALDDQPALSNMFPQGEASKKKTGLAAIYSLLLPGMGELYADGFESGKYFLIAEGTLWLTYASFEIAGNQLRDDSREYAKAHAGVSPANKDDQYFVDIGNFISTDEYNQKKLRDRDYQKLYNDPGYQWQWDSPLSRATFRDQRIASENMYNNRKFVFAAILVNHVASAINAVRAAISYNNSLSDAVGSLDIRADVMGGTVRPLGIMVTVSKKF